MVDIRSGTAATGPLQGIRVIDLSAVVSGPFGTSILADQGADVIMVEQAHAPDLVRNSGPLADTAQGVSAVFNSINRNKRSITLNLKHDEGKALLKRLVADADVVVQNFRPGALDRLGVGWDVLRQVNPELIMCSISGFGSDGPYSHRPAFDPVVQCISGYPVVQAAGGRPTLMGTIVCDKVTSLNVAQAICAALVARANGHGGQHIELAMVDASIHFLWPEAMWNNTYLDHDIEMPELTSLYRLFQTIDGWALVYSVSTDAQWLGMCRAFERPDLATDPRFVDLQARTLHSIEMNDEIEKETGRYTTAELVDLMDRHDVPVAPVNTRQEVIDDPHVRHRNILVESEHPTAGRLRSVRPPALFSATPAQLRLPAPTFGQHTDEVLQTLLGLDGDAVAALRADGVIA